MKIFIEPTFSDLYRKYPLVLIDIGASGGIEANWYSAQKYLRVIGFEPDAREFYNLEKKVRENIEYLNTGLYKEKVTLDFYLARKQQASSIFRPNKDFNGQFPEVERFDIINTEKIKMDSLDNQFKVHSINDSDFIKLDTQGSELFVLQGATETIKEHIFGIEVEVEFSEMYKNQPLFSEVDSFIRSKGFYLFDLQGFYWKRKNGKNYGKGRGQLVSGNVLYLRNIIDFIEVVRNIENKEERKSKVLKAFSICSIYGYFDYALELLLTTKDLFSKEEYGVVYKWIKSSFRFENIIPNFKGKAKIARFFYLLFEIFRPSCNGWATVERTLGNL